MGEGRLPSVGRTRRPSRLQGKPLAERIQLPLVRHFVVRRKSADFDETAAASGGELLDQRRLADSSASAAHHKGRCTLLPKLEQRRHLALAAYEF